VEDAASDDGRAGVGKKRSGRRSLTESGTDWGGLFRLPSRYVDHARCMSR
jgi:hypothetical protein